MEDGGPYSGPAHIIWIDGLLIDSHDVVYGVVEQGNQTGNAHDGERLSPQYAKYHSGQCGREQAFINAVKFARAPVHVKRICDSGENVEPSVNIPLT